MPIRRPVRTTDEVLRHKVRDWSAWWRDEYGLQPSERILHLAVHEPPRRIVQAMAELGIFDEIERGDIMVDRRSE